MTALGLVNTLRAKTRAVEPAAQKDGDYGWGTYKELRDVDTKTLTRQELRSHLEARDLATTGNKGQLALRLEASVLEEQSKAYADAEDAEFQLAADLEERGGHRLGTGAFDDDDEDLYMEPRPIRDLVGEEICQAGSSHCLAASMGGDLYVWGRGESGQLGLGDRESKQIPILNARFPEGTEVSQVAVGENHSLVLTKAGSVYSWGHGDRGRLGVGACWRVGVPQSEKNIFPTPMLLHTFSKEIVRQASYPKREGCVLGHGDTRTRETPVQIEALKGSMVLQAECGTWHCAALVLVPPCKDGGYLYTWGSGYHGQLALGTRQVQPTPAIVAKLLSTQQLLRKVWCGSHHCAAVTTDGELYTWGSNRTGCLGRALPAW
ncbi:unnamed protein product [Ectocarpus sp. CCAP 1310/34]|nr:unnamed protein product [Ectocarpus sp. CCAP 1310/34]